MEGAFDPVDYPELLELETTIVRVVPVGKKFGLVLDRTPFVHQHADGGDRGTINLPDGHSLYVSAAEGRELSLHKVKDRAAGSVVAGTPVVVRIDKTYRDALRARHTACHLIYGLAQQRLGQRFLALSRTTLERTFSEWKGMAHQVTDDIIGEIQERARAMIEEARAVAWATLDRETALGLVGRHFAQILPSSATALRVVTISGLAPDPCAGMHVRSLDQISGLTIQGMERRGDDVRVLVAAEYSESVM